MRAVLVLACAIVSSLPQTTTAVATSSEKRPHIVMVLWDDYGWADAGWHRNYTGPGGIHVDATAEIQTPHLNNLVAEGIELDRNYVREPPTSLRLSHR